MLRVPRFGPSPMLRVRGQLVTGNAAVACGRPSFFFLRSYSSSNNNNNSNDDLVDPCAYATPPSVSNPLLSQQEEAAERKRLSASRRAAAYASFDANISRGTHPATGGSGRAASTTMAMVRQRLSQMQRSVRGVTTDTAAEELSLKSRGLYEALPRYPDWSTMGVLRGLDYMGTVSFAVSGSLTAAACGLDLVGGVVVGGVTALGGGTIRDLFFGKAPVFWLVEQEYLYLAVAAAFLAFVACCVVELDSYQAFESIMFWTDTIGLGAFSILGTSYAVRLGYRPLVVLCCTLVTCTGGGLIRDTLCRRPARVLHPFQDTYAITTVVGGAVWLGTRELNLPLALRMPLAAGTVIALRCGAAVTGFKLPAARLLLEQQQEDAPEAVPEPLVARMPVLKATLSPHVAWENLPLGPKEVVGHADLDD